ncbi:MAG: hypothetical protein Q9186_007620 [Xanthomendoza sp. 1 TL-2023]
MAEKEVESNVEHKMQVLVMGMGRCGTTYPESALAAALKILGYRPYDYIDRVYKGDNKAWADQLRAKFHGHGEKWQRAQFEQVLQGFDAILDAPCNFFTDELLAAYPDAVVILNTRSFDSWYESMLSTIWKANAWPSWRLLQYTEVRLVGRHVVLQRLYWDIFSGHDHSVEKCRKAFEDHNDHIRAVVPKERLLEYPIGAGWKPLCDFLGKSVPKETEFPHVNDKGNFWVAQKMLWWYGVKHSCFNALKVMVSLATGVTVVAWVYRRAMLAAGKGVF